MGRTEAVHMRPVLNSELRDFKAPADTSPAVPRIFSYSEFSSAQETYVSQHNTPSDINKQGYRTIRIAHRLWSLYTIQLAR